MSNKMTLNEQAQEILRIAEASGVQSNFFFVTTFKRYQVQIQILNDLEKALKENGTLVTKEYVKGRKNLYDNPAINAYNRTTDSANKTVTTLMKIIRGFKDEESNGDDIDPLLQAINGSDADDE
jgi:tRNA(Phe) wybutosine-synthesizing methylase Tyw3